MYTSPPFAPPTTMSMVEDSILAETVINDYYVDLFDVSISNEDFCNIWVMHPFYEGTLQDCLYGRAFALARNDQYAVQYVIVSTDTPFTIFQAEVSIYDPDSSNTLIYQVDFFIINDNDVYYLVLMDEIIFDVPVT